MAQSTLSKVFVYGTLKQGQPNHYWLTEAARGLANFLTTGSTVKQYPLVIGTRYNIPFLLDKEGTGENIEGEVYEVDEKMISNLDILEDYPTYYDREIQDINTPKGILPCWVYIVRKFPEQMLTKKYLKSYTNSNELPYCERSCRDPNIKSKDDMNY